MQRYSKQNTSENICFDPKKGFKFFGKQFVVFTLILVISLFSPGITVFKVLCGCEGKVNVSMVGYSDPCRDSPSHMHHADNRMAACSSECRSDDASNSDCCNSKKTSPSDSEDINDETDHSCSHVSGLTTDCCESQTDFYQLDNTHTKTNKVLEVEENPSLTFLIPFTTYFIVGILDEIHLETDAFVPIPSSSPPEYGRNLLKKIHIWRN